LEVEAAGQSDTGNTSLKKQKISFEKRAFPSRLKRKDYADARNEGSFCAIQEWEGYVTKIVNNIVFADLVDLVRNEERPSTTAEIPSVEFQDDEVNDLHIGTVFRWSIGYYRSRTGQKDRVSRIRLRKLPVFGKVDRTDVDREAQEFLTYFKKRSLSDNADTPPTQRD